LYSKHHKPLTPLQEQGEVGLSSAGMFLVVSSASLLLIFYFISAMTILVTIIFCLITTLSLATLVYPYFDYWTAFKYAKAPFLQCIIVTFE
jgi:hypothetical protein